MSDGLLRDLDSFLATVAESAASISAPTNLERAARYEILGVVERLRAWRTTADERMLSECETRLGRLDRDVSSDQAPLLDQLEKYVLEARRLSRSASGVIASAPTLAPAGVPSQGHASETFELLVSVLTGLKRGLRRWPHGESQGLAWSVESEDAVQRLVWFALAPHFRQLRSEEPVGATGPPRWRPDFVLPDLDVALEVKFCRTPASWQAVYGQLAEDDGRCRSQGSPYHGLAVVIWDHTKSVERHGEWEDSLLGLTSVRVVSIISRPGPS